MAKVLLRTIAVGVVAVACGGPSSGPTPEKVGRENPPPVETPAKTEANADAKANPPARPEKKPKGPPTFADELAAQDKAIAGNAARVEKAPKSYVVLEQLAGKYLARARLSGDWDDYRKAEETIDKAFGIREGFGPYLARAHLNATLHRLDRVDADIAIVQKTQHRTMQLPAIAGLLAFEGEVAFQRGDYATALARYDRALEMVPGHQGALTGKATLAWKTGKFDEAEKLYDEAESKYHGKSAEPRAWFDLMRGLMDLDRGRYDDALAHYRLAEQELVGWWLVDEHVAEILTLTGKTEDAKALYLDVIERTGNPEFMDAMAGILKAEGKDAEAAEYVAKARAKYEEQLAKYPQAAYGHALGHYLEFGEDPAVALDLAKKNYALRGNGEAATLLAEALMKTGKPKDAKRIVDKTLKTAWRSADLHLVAADVYAAVGKTADAEAQKAAALAINPRAAD